MRQADSRIRAALQRLASARPGEAVTVKELARSVHLSPARFSHLFALATGMPPRQYLKMHATEGKVTT